MTTAASPPAARRESGPDMSGRWRTAAALGLAYGLAAVLSLLLARQPGSIASIWYANALAIAVLSARRRADWPALALSVALANAVANWIWGDPFLSALSFVPANLIEILLGAWLLQRSGLAGDLGTPRRFLQLSLLGAVLPQIAGATLGALKLAIETESTFLGAWLPWFESDAIGAVSLLPLAYLLAHRGWSGCRTALLEPRLIALLPITIGVILLAFALLPYPFVYIVLPLMAAAVLVQFAGVALLTFVVSVTMTAALALGILVPPPLRAEWQQLFVYLAFAASLLPAQLLAAVLVQFAGVALLTLVVSVTMTAALALGILVPPPLRAEWQQLFVYLAFAASLLTAQLLAAALAELHESRAALAERERQLRRVNEGLEQFVRISSHDLREPLNTVVQFGALLERDASDRLEDRHRRYLAAMLQGTRRMRTLLDDVLQFARVQRSAPMTDERVDLDALLSELRVALAHRIESSGAHLEVESLPAVRGNPSLLSLLFQNLIANALKFMPEGRAPLVRIWARARGAQILITVADNGIGIAEQDLGRLFQPFQRLNLQRLYEGSGLGLALARQIAEAHGGSISVASTPGEGSRFTVTLPAADASQAPRGA